MQAMMNVSHNKGVNLLMLAFHPKLAFLLLSLESTKLMNRCYFLWYGCPSLLETIEFSTEYIFMNVHSSQNRDLDSLLH